MTTRTESAGWSRRYQLALRNHLKQGPAASLQPALRLGRQAMALGMAILAMAKIHETAQQDLFSSRGGPAISPDMNAQANRFLAETLIPIEHTHQAALKAKNRINRLKQQLQRRTAESSNSRVELKRRIAQRRAAEGALAESGKNSAKLLLASKRLQNRLRLQTRAILAAQELKRLTISQALRDEVMQTLVAIKLRLHALTSLATVSRRNLATEVAETRRVVQQSSRTIRRLVSDFGGSHDP